MLIAASIWHESVNAAELGRLFYTPQQRQQLDVGERNSGGGGSTSDNVRRNYIIVNGVVQKKGGNRTVWINGTAQAAERGNDRNPASVPVTVPGKPRPVQLKVGERLMLEAPAPEEPQ
ncbi:hypothetical protein MIZ01_0616 [Sideroxyarcus emersonii]|uniref:Uncharacterized protein n=1 Tax=Sideroxyarcus emersonii TaxID=2764705 RepID=A0AAN1X8P4_9PROT|nr:hypothetical protein [Sideroxyarcus emersonii]BCK86850.1 hypothetical protein MIZ01_0616 [Sideroxyarcus emersonii]